ncbi:MAG: polysaccharide deacetylase [Hyphomicrobiaceae bacterium]
MTTTVCLSFDFDAVSLWVSTFKQTTPTALSRGVFGARVGIGRILALLARKAIPATFFVPGHTAEIFPDEVRSIAKAGHEIALHGYCHETPVGRSREEEMCLLRGSIAKLRATLGDSFSPAGYRSPSWDLSPATISCLEEVGLLYDSSMMADDFRPYRARAGTTADEESYNAGTPARVIEIPVAWELDDYPYFHFSSRINQGLRTPDEVFEIWKGEFDYCREEMADGVFTLTMHPQIIGRGPRIRMLDRLIDHMAASPEVRFSTIAETARRFATLDDDRSAAR